MYILQTYIIRIIIIIIVYKIKFGIPIIRKDYILISHLHFNYYYNVLTRNADYQAYLNG